MPIYTHTRFFLFEVSEDLQDKTMDPTYTRLY